MVMLGFAAWKATTSLFHCSSDLPPLSVLSGGQSTVIVTLPASLELLVQAARVSPMEATSTTAMTPR